MLRAFGAVKVLVVGSEQESSVTGNRREEFEVVGNIAVGSHPNRGIVEKIDWFVNPRSPFPHGRSGDAQEFERALARAGEFDLMWFFKLRTANAFDRWSWPRSVVDIDDVPSTFERTVVDSQVTAGGRFAASLRVWSWQRRERLLGERFSALTVCSDADESYLRNIGVKAPISVVPNGYQRPTASPVRRPANPPRLGFIGVLDHEPNADGVRWFARECWPRIKRQIPEARLRLVGRLSDSPAAPKGNDIDGLGWLEDPAGEMATWTATVVPVHIGAGTRGKIAHAFSQKCPVVSTTLGAYGFDARNGRTMLLADSAEDFAAACVRMILEPATATAIAEEAWREFLARWTWDAIRPNVLAAAETALQAN
jgi:glycosyltransferase involved in cell wall biosynthesis